MQWLHFWQISNPPELVFSLQNNNIIFCTIDPDGCCCCCWSVALVFIIKTAYCFCGPCLLIYFVFDTVFFIRRSKQVSLLFLHTQQLTTGWWVCRTIYIKYYSSSTRTDLTTNLCLYCMCTIYVCHVLRRHFISYIYIYIHCVIST